MMQSIFWTGRVLSRAIRNGLSSFSSAAELSVSNKKHPYLVSVVCGFPKDIANGRTRKGQYGDDAWFSTNFNNADVIGRFYERTTTLLWFHENIFQTSLVMKNKHCSCV